MKFLETIDKYLDNLISKPNLKINFLEKFIFKNVFIYFIILSIVTLVLLRDSFMIITALGTGTIIAILKTFLMGKVFDNILISENENFKPWKISKKLIISWSVIAIVFLFIMKLGTKYFISMAIGVLLPNFFVFINSLTESIGITKNNFGG